MLNQSRQIAPPTERHTQLILDLISSGYDLPMLLEYCDTHPYDSSGLLGAVFSWAMTLKELDDNDEVRTNYRPNRIRYSR